MTARRTRLLAASSAIALWVAGCASAPDLARITPDPGAVYRAHLADRHGGADQPVLTDNSTLADYLRYAALNNPGLESAFHRWQAALERIPQVTSLPEPSVNFRVFVLAMDTRASVGIEQMIPGANKLRLSGDAAFEASEAERERVEAERIKLVNAVKKAYFEYYYLARTIAVTRENRELVKALQDVATARYRVGAAQLSDVLKGQVELGRMDDEVRSVEALRTSSAGRINAALNRPPSAPLPFPAAIALENVTLVDDDVIAAIAASSPELRVMDREVAEQKVMQERAKAEYNPDYIIGAEYMFPTSEGEHQLALILGFTLPIRTAKYKAMFREALLRERAAAAAKQQKLNELSSDAQMALYEIRDAERKIDLYQHTLIPTARQSLKTTETAYATGKAGFLDLLDIERQLLEFQLSYERALATHAQKIAELEMIVGTDLPRDATPPPAVAPPEAEPPRPGTPSEAMPKEEDSTKPAEP